MKLDNYFDYLVNHRLAWYEGTLGRHLSRLFHSTHHPSLLRLLFISDSEHSQYRVVFCPCCIRLIHFFSMLRQFPQLAPLAENLPPKTIKQFWD